jgi:transposase-like protein
MENYPKNLMEFDERFGSEKSCRDYLMKLRWPDGFRCPRCGEGRSWITQRGLLHCAACDHQTSPTAGTVFQDTRKPLRMWFKAMWWVTSQKTGASAVGMQQALGLGSYQTAWTWLHKLRRAMVRPGRDRLSGVVEVDETYVGGYGDDVTGRGSIDKALVAIAVERQGRRWGRTRMKVIAEATSEVLGQFVEDSVEPGSMVRTDGWRGYLALANRGYRHDRYVQKNRPESAAELLPGVHRIASLLKRWLLGTHHGKMSHYHLGYYLDEFAFRFNRRTSRHRGKLFYRLLQQAVAIEPITYRGIIQPKDYKE